MSTRILSGDIELRTSERMTDADDGGGEMSATVISDNVINQLFGPISESDRVAGRVNLRQAYLHISTNTADVYRGANQIIDSPPTDPSVTALLFTLGKSGASRLDAKTYIENYISIGPRSRMHPVGSQNAGQGQILAYQRVGAPLPAVGDVYVLHNEATQDSQAFKIQAVSSYTDTFSYQSGGGYADYTATVVIMTLTQPLEYTFPGNDPTPLMPGQSWIRRSVVSDSAQYRGITKLAADASSGVTHLTVVTTQASLLPVTSSEQPILNTPVESVVNTISAGSHNVEVSNFGHSRADAVSQANRLLNWNATLHPIPSTGTLSVSYRTGGKWYTLTDDGTGALLGDSTAYGSCSLSFVTGATTVTLGDLPDIGSSIIWIWGSAAHYRIQTEADNTSNNPQMNLSLSEACVPNTLVINYIQNGVPLTATTTTAGVITGTGVTGHLWATFGFIALRWTILPDANSQISCDYDAVSTFAESPHHGVWEGSGSILSNPTPVVAHAPVLPGSLSVAWEIACNYAPAVPPPAPGGLGP